MPQQWFGLFFFKSHSDTFPTSLISNTFITIKNKYNLICLTYNLTYNQIVLNELIHQYAIYIYICIWTHLYLSLYSYCIVVSLFHNKLFNWLTSIIIMIWMCKDEKMCKMNICKLRNYLSHTLKELIGQPTFKPHLQKELKRINTGIVNACFDTSPQMQTGWTK